ncbi:unnamed protein product [Symbiodinium microadriaticum]|nr:unnamed protein product [Symbiodinium microadriaticum]
MAAASTEIPEALAATASVAAGVTDNTTPLAATASVAAGAAVVAVAAAAEAAVASVVDHGSVQAQACAAIQAAQAASGKSQAHQVANQPWDAHLEDPSSQKGYSFIPEMTPEERRVSLNVCGPRATDFMNRCEFIGLGCYCAPSYALQLMGLRKNSYPFDWTRSSLEGVLHCIDVKFEDFMTYSTYQMVDQHVVFGGTRWGGSFWHHNLEAPLTLEDMTRRVRRFLGLGDVPTKVPRVFVRIINSTRELRQLQRLRQTLKEAFPDAQEIYLLILVELQNERGPIVVNAPEGEGVVVFSFTEEEFRQVPAPGRHPLALSGGRCCEAIAAAVKFWSRDGADGLELKTYDKIAITIGRRLVIQMPSPDVLSMPQLAIGGPPTLHLVGNHELYNFPRKEMEEGIALPELSEPYRISAPPVLDPEAPSSTSSYYSFCPSHGWRVCVLDPYEISIMSGGGARPGIDADAELDSYAVELCQANNPNDITKEDFARGIAPGPALRWVPLNGAVSQQQLQWLEDTLREASDQEQRTILLSHVVLLPEATPRGNGLTLLWNYDEVLDIIRRAADPPVAAMCGHAHLPVCAVDKVCGTHHITLPSPLEVEPGSDACAVVLAHHNGDIEIKGRGDIASCRLSTDWQRRTRYYSSPSVAPSQTPGHRMGVKAERVKPRCLNDGAAAAMFQSRLPARVVTHTATSVMQQQAALTRSPDCRNKCSTVPETSLACPSVFKWAQQAGLWQMWPIGTWNALPSSQRQNGAAASVAFFPAPVSASAEMLKVNPAQAWHLSSLAGSTLLSVDSFSYRGPLSVSVGLAACLSQRALQERVDKKQKPSIGRFNLSNLSSSKWHGVNYGNRFIPEDWMKHPYNFFDKIRKSARRVALWDLQGPEAKQTMLRWLDATICETHFKEMQRYGVEVLRVPCGYWNWVTYDADDGPEVPDPHASIQERLKNLHRIASPRDYRIYFDKIFEFADKYGIKVLLDLHALPGSQNGEIHSGVCIEDKEEHLGFVHNDANLRTSVRAVRAMAEFASQKPNLFGIQVISEPHLHTDEGHEFLRSYYQQAILAAREFLDRTVPVVLFEWTYEMHRWEAGAFPESTYGRVIWDTHLYHFPESGQKWTSRDQGLEKAKEAYAWDLQQLRHFSRAQGETVFVGEFSLAGPSLNMKETREFAQWLVEQFDFACAGSLLWSFDNSITAWSMQRQIQEWGLDWKSILRGEGGRTVEHPPIKIEAAPFGTWLTATEKGAVQADAPDPSWWEEWVPYSYQVNGKSKLALRSAAHGTWLSVTQEGEVIQSDCRSAWEEFSVLFLEKTEDGRQCISLQSFHGSWLAVRRPRPTDQLLLSARIDSEATAWLLA